MAETIGKAGLRRYPFWSLPALSLSKVPHLREACATLTLGFAPKMKEPYPIAPLDYRGARLVIRADTEAERKWRAHIAAKEPRTIEWIEKFARPGDIAYDIGANVGSVSLH